MEQKTKEGYDIMIGRFLDFEPSHYNFINATKCNLMILDKYVWKHGSISGFIYVGDATGMSFGHLTRFNPIIMKKFISYIQDALPVRLIAIHIINTLLVTELLFNMFKPFMHTNLQQMVKTYFLLYFLNKSLIIKK